MTDTTTKDLVRRLRNPVGLVTENIIALNNEAAGAIERLSERCEAYKGQVKAGSAEIERLTASAPVDGDEIVANAPEKLKALGARFADLLDADHWNNIEPLLLDIGRMFAALGEPCGHCHGSGDDQNHMNDPGPCHHCDGTGVVPAARTPEPDADVVERAARLIDPDGFAAELTNEGREEARAAAKRLAAANLLRTPAGRPDREAVARIIDPFAFDFDEDEDRAKELKEEARKKADAILALYPAAPSDAEAVREAWQRAIEHAECFAKGVEALLAFLASHRDAIEEDFPDTEGLSEHARSVTSLCYEFRKRAARALPPAPARGGERTCATCNAIVADGPQPAAVYEKQLSPQAGVDEWQTFDTAPETGEEILCYRPDAGVFVALYRMPDEGDEPCWFATTGDDLTGDLPTHWMPMPSEPRPASREAAE